MLRLRHQIILALTAFLFTAGNAAADFRSPSRGKPPATKRCDESALAAAQSYLDSDPKEIKRINFRSIDGRTIQNCMVTGSYMVDGKEYRQLNIFLGDFRDIDVITRYHFDLLVGENYVYRPKGRVFTDMRTRTDEEAEVEKIFESSGCITLESYSSLEMFFRRKVPCTRHELKEPFEGSIETCDGEKPVVKKFGFRAGTKSWREMLTAADAAFQSAGLVNSSGAVIDENELLWGDPYTTVALIPKDGGYQWAVLTTGYIRGEEPSIFTVVSPSGGAAPAAALKRDNYTCENLVSWVKEGIPESIRDPRFSEGSPRKVTARPLKKVAATPEDTDGDGSIDEQEKLLSELLDQ